MSDTPLTGAEFKAQLHEGKPKFGLFVNSHSPTVAEQLAHTGYDWLLVDVAAAPIDTLCAQRIQQAARCPVLIRVAETSASAIHHALDTGATGLILPGIRCAADVEQVIAACRYPPLGKRAVGMARAQGYGHNLKTYIDDANEEIVIVPQVDHIDAVREIEAIAAVSGFNALFIEPQGIAADRKSTRLNSSHT